MKGKKTMKKAFWTILLASALALAGCATSGCKNPSSGPVHPTDDQINSAAPGESEKVPYPYTPWWVEMGFN